MGFALLFSEILSQDCEYTNRNMNTNQIALYSQTMCDNMPTTDSRDFWGDTHQANVLRLEPQSVKLHTNFSL